ncbi:MAG: hypothetical protein ACRD2G_03110 [Terriglobia bacterium]
MLIIRKEQMAAFAGDGRKRFERRMMEYIASEYPEKYKKLGETKAKELVLKGIEAGRRNGIGSEGTVAALVELMLEFGERFELSPDPSWAQEILAHDTLPGGVKVEIIGERFREMSQGRIVEAADGEQGN